MKIIPMTTESQTDIYIGQTPGAAVGVLYNREGNFGVPYFLDVYATVDFAPYDFSFSYVL